MVARLNSMGEVVEDGDQVEIGGNDKYVSLCRQHGSIKIWRHASLRPAWLRTIYLAENNKEGGMSVELFRGITLHHKDGYDVHPIIKDGGVKIGGEVSVAMKPSSKPCWLAGDPWHQ